MEIGGVLSVAWSLYQRFLGRFFMTALAVFVVLDLFSALADRATGDNTGANVFWFLLGALISVVGYFWVQAALVETVNRKSTRLNSSHMSISYAVFCLKKKT